MGADKNEEANKTKEERCEEIYMGGYSQETTWAFLMDVNDKMAMGLRVGKMKSNSFPNEHRGNPCFALYQRLDRPTDPHVVPLSWHWVRKVEYYGGMSAELTLQYTCYRSTVDVYPFTGEGGSDGLMERLMQLVEWVKDDLAFEGSSGLGMDKKAEGTEVAVVPTSPAMLDVNTPSPSCTVPSDISEAPLRKGIDTKMRLDDMTMDDLTGDYVDQWADANLLVVQKMWTVDANGKRALLAVSTFKKDDGKIGLGHGANDGPAKVAFWPTTGVRGSKQWLTNGMLHRDPKDGPALITCRQDGGITSELYFVDGKVVDKPVTASAPAMPPASEPISSTSTEPAPNPVEPAKKTGKTKIKTECWPNGNMKEQWFFKEGVLHRPASEGPAYRRLYGNGRDWEEEYYTNGKMHNSNGFAARARYYKNGHTHMAEYTDAEGNLHREGGPAQLYYHEDGSEDNKTWYKHGMVHRDPKDGAAVIRHVEGLKNPVLEYWVDGKQVDPPLGQ